MMATLPTGARGRAVALALVGIAAALVWLGAAAPLLDWHRARAERLAQRQTLAAHMEAMADTLPQLRRRAASVAAGPAAGTLLEGSSDAVAAAALQGQLEKLAGQAGVTLSSTELLPMETAQDYRRVRLRLAVSGAWPAFVKLLQEIDQATPRMLVDDLQLQPAPSVLSVPGQMLGATLTVVAFRPKGVT